MAAQSGAAATSSPQSAARCVEYARPGHAPDCVGRYAVAAPRPLLLRARCATVLRPCQREVKHRSASSAGFAHSSLATNAGIRPRAGIAVISPGVPIATRSLCANAAGAGSSLKSSVLLLRMTLTCAPVAANQRPWRANNAAMSASAGAHVAARCSVQPAHHTHHNHARIADAHDAPAFAGSKAPCAPPATTPHSPPRPPARAAVAGDACAYGKAGPTSVAPTAPEPSRSPSAGDVGKRTASSIEVSASRVHFRAA